MKLASRASSPKNKKLLELENFQDEHQRLLRSLSASLEREIDLYSELRRLKDSVISLSTRFNAALKVAQDDEITIAELRKEAEISRTEAIIARKQVEDAGYVIASLRSEVTSLKKTLFHLDQSYNVEGTKPTIFKSYGSSTNSQESNGIHPSISLGVVSDNEVDEMFYKIDEVQVPSGIADLSDKTAFQKWKVENYIYTSDTPAGSQHHDPHSVEKTEQLLLMQSLDEFKSIPRTRKPTKSSNAKTLLSPLNKDEFTPLDRTKSKVHFDLPRVPKNNNDESASKQSYNSQINGDFKSRPFSSQSSS